MRIIQRLVKSDLIANQNQTAVLVVDLRFHRDNEVASLASDLETVKKTPLFDLKENNIFTAV